MTDNPSGLPREYTNKKHAIADFRKIAKALSSEAFHIGTLESDVVKHEVAEDKFYTLRVSLDIPENELDPSDKKVLDEYQAGVQFNAGLATVAEKPKTPVAGQPQKKWELVESMISDAPTGVLFIAAALNISDSAARSLIGDLKRKGIEVMSRKNPHGGPVQYYIKDVTPLDTDGKEDPKPEPETKDEEE